MKKPHRRFETVIKIGSDTKLELVSALYNIWTYFDMNAESMGCASGSPGCGYSIDIKEDAEMNNERYFKELHEFLAQKKKEKGVS